MNWAKLRCSPKTRLKFSPVCEIKKGQRRWTYFIRIYSRVSHVPPRTLALFLPFTTSRWIRCEKYDMIFNGGCPLAPPGIRPENMPAKTKRMVERAVLAGAHRIRSFGDEVSKYPVGGASNDLIPELQHPKNSVPALDPNNMLKAISSD